jgi:erythromycin esterase-like protein
MPRANAPAAATLHEALGEAARLLTGAAREYDPLLERIGDAPYALIGEASHGTHEFYRERAEITRRLIEEKGYTAVAVEADWPDAARVDRYVRGRSDDRDAASALAGFERFPTWMWRNADVLAFVDWLRVHNDGLPFERRVGFYGLDLYALHTSIAAVLDYLERVDPEAAARARYRYACFEHFGEDPQAYGYAAGFGLSASCEAEVLGQLVELRRRAAELASRDGVLAEDDFFFAEQNARLIASAERYYRTMFSGRVASWNLRDRHMAETLDALVRHLGRRGRRPKVAIWAHNSHLGDARATEMGEQGELNIGQLARERYGRDAVLVGLTTYEGTVTAASAWGGPAERKRVRPALAGSWEALFHDLGLPRFLLLLGEPDGRALAAMPPPVPPEERRLERAIGVVYLPRSERASHYFHARLGLQFDAVLHFDTTSALVPLESTAEWEAGEPPETFPSGL